MVYLVIVEYELRLPSIVRERSSGPRSGGLHDVEIAHRIGLY